MKVSGVETEESQGSLEADSSRAGESHTLDGDTKSLAVLPRDPVSDIVANALP